MVYQISVFLENRAGQFAEITNILAENGIDLRAISIAESTDYGVLRMIVDNAEKTTSILMQHGYLMSMTPVTVIAVPDEPGGIAPVLAKIAEGNVDIEYMYSLIDRGTSDAYMVFRFADDANTLDVLEANGLKTVPGSKLGLN